MNKKLYYLQYNTTQTMYAHLPAAECTSSSDVVGGRGYLCAVDDHAEVADGSTIVVGLPFENQKGEERGRVEVVRRTEKITRSPMC